MIFSRETRKQVLLAVLVGLGVRLFFVWRFPIVDDDSPMYEELARNWLDHHVYGLYLNGPLTAVDVRMPGYPGFLAVVYMFFGRSRLAVMLAQVVVDLATCFLTALLAARLAPEARRPRVAVAALWLAATCPFLANYVVVPLTEVLATFLTAAALLFLVAESQGETRTSGSGHPLRQISPWFLGGFLVGLGTLVRPETPLLLASTGLVLAARWCRPADWPKLFRAGVLMAAGLLVPLAPWAARNWHTLHRVQFLAPRYVQLPGEFVPRGFLAWSKTWLVRYRDIDQVLFKLEHAPIEIGDIPSSAFDTPQERERVAALLQTQHATLRIPPETDREFARLARERTARHPLRTNLRIPLERAATIWFTPRIELLPYSGDLWPPGRQWEDDPVDFSVTLGLGLLNLLYVALALAGAFIIRRQPALLLLAAWIFVRTAFLAAEHITPEPRFVLVCFPAVLALAAMVWARRAPQVTLER